MAPDHPAFVALLGVLAGENRWIKLSAPYETSKLGPPGYDDVSALASALVRAHPGRCLWASNWPHPGQTTPPTTNELVALRDRWLPTDELRQRVLVDNPADLYGF